MEDFKLPKVTVTMRITEEAAETLSLYAGSREQGRLVSQLLAEYRQRREELAAEKEAAVKKASAEKAVDSAARARDRIYPGGLPGGKKKGRR